MSKPIKRTEPKPVLIHAQSTSNPDKGRCGKRGRNSKMLAIVTCPECRPTLPQGATRSTAAAAMHKIAGA